MDILISLGVNAVLEALKDKAKLVKFVDAFAKVYVKIERVAATNMTLTEAIRRQREKA